MLCVMIFAGGLTPVMADRANLAESARLRWVTNELEDARRAHAAATNEAERALGQQRIELAGKALENYRQQADLERREQELSRERQRSADFSLRKALSAVEMDEEGPKRAIGTLNTDIRKLKDRRNQAAQRQASLAASSDPDMAALAKLEYQMANFDAEIMARMRARDAEELKRRLAYEANRIDAIFSAVEQDVRVTLRMLVHGRRQIKRNRERLEEFTLLRRDLESQMEDTDRSAEIARRRVEQLQQEIEILSHRTQVEKESGVGGSGEDKRGMFSKLFGSGSAGQRQLEGMVKEAQEEIALLNARLDHLQDQGANMRKTMDLASQGMELFDAEHAFLLDRLSALNRRYIRRVLMPVAIVILIVAMYQLISRFLFPWLLKHDDLFIARRLGSYGAALVVMVVLIAFFLEDLKAIAAIMGIVGAAIVIALQDMCSAFAGWFVIVSSRKLRVGDRVEINGRRGEIIDIEMLRTTLVEINNWLGVDEATGRTLIIPNSFIFKSDVFNYSHVHPYIWGKVDVTMTFESPPEATYALLLKALTEETREAYAEAMHGGDLMEKRYGVSRAVFEPHVHTVIADSGVCYSLFYVAHYRQFTAMRDRVMTRVLRDVNQAPGIEFAYPTERHIPTPPAIGA